MRVNLNLVVGTVAIVATGAILFMVFRQGKSIAEAAGTAAAAINPLNSDNVFAKAADAVVQTVTGDPSASVGSKIADLFDKSGAIATAPSYPKNVINLADYFSNVDRDDADMAPAAGFGSTQYAAPGDVSTSIIFGGGA